MAKTRVAMVAKEIRAELKETFPTVKFSVRSSNYSMGCSIRVEWTDLPSVEAVEAITEKYSQVRRCELSGDILSGGNMFVFAEQELSPEFKELIESQMEEHEKDSLYWRKQAMSRIMNIMWDEQNNKEEVNTEMEMSSDVTINDNTTNHATLTINQEKNGIEIKFSFKPSENVIEALKEMGFKWSKFASKWWAKNTPERLKFAHMMVDGFNSIIEEEPETTALEGEYEAPAASENIDVQESIVQNNDESKTKPDNVIPFTKFANKKAKSKFDTMTPETRLKLYAITTIIGKDDTMKLLQDMDIEQLFKYVAEAANVLEEMEEL